MAAEVPPRGADSVVGAVGRVHALEGTRPGPRSVRKTAREEQGAREAGDR